MDKKSASLSFSLFEGIGPKTFLRLLNKFGSAKSAWKNLDSKNSGDTGISKNLYNKFHSFRNSFDLKDYLKKLNKTKVETIGYTEKEYPDSLKKLDSPPIVLYCKGNLDLLNSYNNIGVVGARKITSYGKDVTEKITSELVSNGFLIVSGLAFGVDAAAHKTALENHGNTIAVLGCGVDCCTPSENQNLYEKILDNKGLIISEYPLGMPPSKGSFPARNRIIAGMSLGVLITEAAEDSGSLITAGEAIKLGLPVFAVPGSINSMMSKGALKLLKQGAKLAQNAQDIMDELNIKDQILNIKKTNKIFKNLNAGEKKIVKALEVEPLSLDLLSKQTKIPIYKLLGIITNLELAGILKNSGGEISIYD
jgi:DNA processing protein